VTIDWDPSVTTVSWKDLNYMRPNSYVGFSVDEEPEFLLWVPVPPDQNNLTVTNSRIVLFDPVFSTQAAFEEIFPESSTATLRVKKPWWHGYLDGTGEQRALLVDTVDPNIRKVPAELSAKIGIRPDAVNNPDSLESADTAFLDGYKGLAGPLRVAKFIVTSVDTEGGITGIKVIDRGLYKVFPSDLTYGIPLEYDYELQGLNSARPGGDISQRWSLMGVGDPARNNIGYGPGHPEYAGYPYSSQGNELRRRTPLTGTPPGGDDQEDT